VRVAVETEVAVMIADVGKQSLREPASRPAPAPPGLHCCHNRAGSTLPARAGCYQPAPRTNRGCARCLKACNQLPPLPAVPTPLSHQTRFLPRAISDTNLDTRYRRHSGPSDSSNSQVARLDFLVCARLRDQTPYSLQGDRLPHYLSFALPLISIDIGLVMAGERLVDHLNLG